MGIDVRTDMATILPHWLDMRRQGQVARGTFLDAFAQLEAAIISYLQRLNQPFCPTAPLAQKLALLEQRRDRFRSPKKLDERIDAIRPLLAMRNDVVHAQLALAAIFDGSTVEHHLCFRNVGDAGLPPRLVTIDQLASAARRVDQLARQFSQQQLKATAPTGRASASG